MIFWPIFLLIIHKESQVLFKLLDSFVLISNILFSFLVKPTTNYSLLSNITLSSNLYNFHVLSLNNLVNLSVNILFIVATKYIILDSLLHTTKIVLFSATNVSYISYHFWLLVISYHYFVVFYLLLYLATSTS